MLSVAAARIFGHVTDRQRRGVSHDGIGRTNHMQREEVELVLPGVLFGGDLRGFLDYLGLHGRPLGNNRWAVWPNNDKVFISHYGLADDTEFVNRFDHLKNMPLASPHLD